MDHQNEFTVRWAAEIGREVCGTGSFANTLGKLKLSAGNPAPSMRPSLGSATMNLRRAKLALNEVELIPEK
jgi:hypothetical protein